MTYSHRNIADEQQEACQKARQITAICEHFQITLDPIDWHQFGMRALVKVSNIAIASLLDLGRRDRDALLRQVQITLFAHAALETLHDRPGLKVLMWSPVDVVQPQAFLSFWIIILETDERIPIIESIKNGQRVYEHYRFDGDDGQQLSSLFGPVKQGDYHLGATISFKEHERHYTGEILYIIPPSTVSTSRPSAFRRSHPMSARASTNEMGARYLIDCNDGFPHIVQQWQVIQ